MDSRELAFKIRCHGLEMTHLSHGSHIGSILSVADIIAVLYADILNVDPTNPQKEDRDRFILSKGHAGASVYAALAETGFFDVDELKTHYADGSRLSGHVSHKGIPGVEFSTGSLGHGLSVAAGMAYAAKMDNKKYRVFVVLGDGECDEGSVWEASLFAHHHHLDNLTVIVDHNKMQSLTFCEDTLSIDPLVRKFREFGFETYDINGNDHEELKKTLSIKSDSGLPKMIVANTVKGKGVSFMENDILWHYRWPREDEFAAAVKEITQKYNNKEL